MVKDPNKCDGRNARRGREGYFLRTASKGREDFVLWRKVITAEGRGSKGTSHTIWDGIS